MQTADVRRHSIQKNKQQEPNRAYIRKYNNGVIHAVIVAMDGKVMGQLVDSERLITQYPLSRNTTEGRIYSAIVEWIHPSINVLSGLTDTGHTDATQERPGTLSDGINLETNRQRLGESSQGEGGSQDGNIRWKIDEDRTNNPVTWASIVLARDIKPYGFV